MNVVETSRWDVSTVAEHNRTPGRVPTSEYPDQMPCIRIYRNPNCAKCARYARMHRALDWLGRVETSTETPPGHAPLRMGQIVVEDLGTGIVHEGVAAFRKMCEAVPLYRPMLLLMPFAGFRRRVERELMGDCDGDACAV